MNFYRVQINSPAQWWKFLDEAVENNYRSELKGEHSYKLKRLFDILTASLGFIFLAPLFIVIIISIRITSRGPAIFKQMRIGKDGKLFKLYKFRAMKVANEEDEIRKRNMIKFMKEQGNNNDIINNKVINNNRVTQVGRFLRKTSLDELPQLYNVIKGDMSMVGPRPCLIYEFENYEQWHKKRLTVLPGCTGFWQIWGRGKVSFTESVIMDIYYANNLSLITDIKLILKTIPLMLFGIGGK
jgi:lipopolysaccharide/colanic/teichoic acid biosynthesis glycosyltransferase